MHIRDYQDGDEHAITDIYNYYIENSTATFELETVSVAQMRERIEKYRKAYVWLVCEHEQQVVGYAYASPFHDRGGYKHTVETSVYVAHDTTVKSVGRSLYEQLLKYLEEQTDCHVVIAVVTKPNESSEKLHQDFGFRVVGDLLEVGWKFGRWIDVGYWQKRFERPGRPGGTG